MLGVILTTLMHLYLLRGKSALTLGMVTKAHLAKGLPIRH